MTADPKQIYGERSFRYKELIREAHEWHELGHLLPAINCSRMALCMPLVGPGHLKLKTGVKHAKPD